MLVACKSSKQAKSSKGIEKNTNSNNTSLLEVEELAFGRSFIDGCSAKIKNDLDIALKYFLECQTINPKSAAVKYELAKIYLEKKSILLALENAKFCATADVKNEYYQKILIDCYNENKQYNQAIKVSENLVKNFPDVIEFKEDLAIQYASINEFNKSFNLYNEIEAVYGINEQITNNKVKLLNSQGKTNEAEKELLKLCATDNSNTDYLVNLAEFYEETNKQQKAKEIYDKILEIDPNHPTVNLSLSDYYNLQKEPIKSFEYLRKAFHNPDLDPTAKATIAFNYYLRSEKSGNNQLFNQGKELAEIFIKVHPKNADANGVMADYLMLENKPKEASNYYYNAATSEKSNYKIWEQLMFVYNELNRFDSLKSISTKAIEFFPNQPNVYFFNGLANIKLKKYPEAISALKDGLEFVIDNKAQMLSFYFNLGEAYFYNNEFEKSDKAFDDALKIDSDNTQVLNNYAYYISVRKSDLDKAEKLARRCNELQPNNRNYMDTYGWILFQQKKYPEAEKWLKNASNIPPPNANILEHYGDALFKLGKTNEALKYWQDALKIAEKNELLENKIKKKEIVE
ncbi:MAG: tetratricopeptide repeat protein [Bacteroidetes bacterium]|nr:tetratricopeptide repeat protein [Bacteroidota bacterium]